MKPSPFNRRRGPATQQGVVLIAALIALVAITMAALSLVRSVDTGLVISGNLAFKQATVNAGDMGTETAAKWLSDNAATAHPEHAPDKMPWWDRLIEGYYASYMSDCDLTGNRTPADTTDDVDWDGSNPGNVRCNMKAKKVADADMPAGYLAYYVVNRMCTAEGNPAGLGLKCSKYVDPTGDYAMSTKGGGSADTPLPGSSKYYYRVTTRIVGPRNTVSYVQALLGM